MSSILFEDPTPLYVVLGLAELVLLIIWYRTRTRRSAFALAIPVSAAALLALIASVVVTDREHIVASIEQIVADINRGDIRSAAIYLDEDYSIEEGVEGVEADDVIEKAETAMRDFGVQDVEIIDLSVTIDGSSATAKISTKIHMNNRAAGEGNIPVHWTIEWIKRPQGWRIVHVARPKVGLQL